MRKVFLLLFISKVLLAFGQGANRNFDETITDYYVLENYEAVLVLLDSMVSLNQIPDLGSLKRAFLSAEIVNYQSYPADSIKSFAQKLYSQNFQQQWDTLNVAPKSDVAPIHSFLGFTPAIGSRVLNDEQEMTIIEEQPEFPGGMSKFYKEVNKLLRYPPAARRMGIEGRVYVEFIILETGKIVEPRAVKGIGAGCDEEAVRIMESMPNFKPGMLEGKPVKVKMVLPIYFKLRN